MSEEKDTTISTPRNNNNKNNINIHTYIYLQHTTKTFYISNSRNETFKKLYEILSRENVSFSDWVFKQAETYVRLHETGNPQQRIDVISELGKAYKANECFDCGAKPKYKVFEKTKRVLVCQGCFERRKPQLKGWAKL